MAKKGDGGGASPRKKAAKKPKVKNSAKKSKAKKTEKALYDDEGLTRIISGLEKVLKSSWKEGNALAKRVAKIDKAFDRIPDTIEKISKTVEALSERIDALDLPSSETVAPTAPSADEIRETVSPELFSLNTAISDLRQEVADLKSRPEPPRIEDVVSEALERDLGPLSARISSLEERPAELDRDTFEASRAALEEEIQKLGERMGSIEPVPPSEPGISMQEVERILEPRTDGLAARIEALEATPEPEGGLTAREVEEVLEGRLDGLRSRLEALENAPAPEGGPTVEEIRAPLAREIQTLGDRLDGLEAAGPAEVPENDSEALDDLSSRIGALEMASSAEGGPSTEELMVSLDEKFESLVRRIEALEKAPAPQAAPTAEDLGAALEEDLKALEKRIGNLESSESQPSGTPEEKVKELIRIAIRDALNAVKAMMAKIEPTVEGVMQKRLDKRMEEVPKKKEVTELAKKGASKALETLKAPGALQAFMGKDFLESTVRDVIESDLFTTFLNSDEMKIMLDDKFKMMRNWLKNDEIPKQVKKLATQ